MMNINMLKPKDAGYLLHAMGYNHHKRTADAWEKLGAPILSEAFAVLHEVSAGYHALRLERYGVYQ